MRAHAVVLVLLIIVLPWSVWGDTSDTPDLVSFSFDAPSAVNYVPNGFLEHVQDTIFAPHNNWFPLIRFIGEGEGSSIEVDALSYGHDADRSLFEFFFSVGVGAQGLPETDVANEVPADDRYSDLYASNKNGDNTQIYDGDGSSAEILGLLENASTNLDGVDMRSMGTQDLLYWSVSRETAETENPYSAAVTSGADIFVGESSDGYSTALPLTVYAQAWDLGLTGSDDVDALVVIDPLADGLFDPAVDFIYYSLVDGSTSLLASGVPPFLGAGPADVFQVGGGVLTPTRAASAAELGLRATDELDALDLAVREEILIALPEPEGTGALLVGAGLVLWLASLRGSQTRWPSPERTE